MLNSLIPIFYVQVSPERLTVRNAKTGEAISEVPEIAIAYEPKERIVSIGKEARLRGSDPSVKIINPFSHPRSMVSDFTVGEQVLKAFLRRLIGNSIFAISPRVVMHLMGEPAGGFTQVEIRAFHEMAIGAGASKVVIWEGRALSDQELLSGVFPSGGEVLS
ncbi:MAG: rod shape-determining protein MreB [Gallionellales bacterium 35-53-114]|jgi:rod shape-determining protein MreB|nr:MAG: rod shape-determining protein MreB [Gallionellales bacterium 35-53-114]OYZ65053.1 MAG: rod shape-determining protein MreB [Gallionellales bacterium 24-53-125]OZB07961.1 MAG: rod shape-determining protein MreB [Gallionellales bacterium 39-52-133]HQS59698.1 rod shape-determining protein [Gallionellaceae bacterium]HQS76452.1 rod shape-determining protein [Gallionellaceae bacterium]